MFKNPEYNSVKVFLLVGVVAVAGYFAYINFGNEGNSALVLNRGISAQKISPCPPVCPMTTTGNFGDNPPGNIWLYGMATCEPNHSSSCHQMEVLKSNNDGTQWSQIAFWGASFGGSPNLTASAASGMFFNGAFRDFANTQIPNSLLGRYSPDGVTWTDYSANFPWYPRAYYTTAQTDPTSGGTKYAYMLGGSNGTILKNDVWQSADGVNWVQKTAAAPWPARSQATAVGFGNKIYMIGGLINNNGTPSNDVWSSADGGTTWTQLTAHAPWSARSSLSSVVYQGYIWIFGGYYAGNNDLSDVWKSSDGINWTQVTNTAAWGEVINPCVLVFNHSLFLIGGSNSFTHNISSLVWKSTDGANWTQVTDIGNLALGGVAAGMCATIPYAVN